MPSTPAERLRAAIDHKPPRVPGRKPGPVPKAKTPLLALPAGAKAAPPTADTPAIPRRTLEARAAQLRWELATITRELDHVTSQLADLTD